MDVNVPNTSGLGGGWGDLGEGGVNWQLFQSRLRGRERKTFPESLSIYIVPEIFPVLPPVRSDT